MDEEDTTKSSFFLAEGQTVQEQQKSMLSLRWEVTVEKSESRLGRISFQKHHGVSFSPVFLFRDTAFRAGDGAIFSGIFGVQKGMEALGRREVDAFTRCGIVGVFYFFFWGWSIAWLEND